MAKLQPKGLSLGGCGLAVGLVWAIGLLVVGWTSIMGWGTNFVTHMASVYKGFGASFGGAFVGAIWGFITGYIGGALFGFFYNRIVSSK